MMKERQNDDDIIDSTGKTRIDPFDLNSDEVDCKDLGGYRFEAWREACKFLKFCKIPRFKDPLNNLYSTEYETRSVAENLMNRLHNFSLNRVS